MILGTSKVGLDPLTKKTSSSNIKIYFLAMSKRVMLLKINGTRDPTTELEIRL